VYMLVRRYRPAGVIDELVRHTRGGVVPLLKAPPGFKGYCVFVGRGTAGPSRSASSTTGVRPMPPMSRWARAWRRT
jgi:hypothetical protein